MSKREDFEGRAFKTGEGLRPFYGENPNGVNTSVSQARVFDIQDRTPSGVDRTDTQGTPNTVLLVTINKMTYPVTLDMLQQTFSGVGKVIRITTFTKNGSFNALVEYQDVLMAQAAKLTLDGHNVYKGCCTLHIEYSKLATVVVGHNSDTSRDYTNPGTCQNQQEFPVGCRSGSETEQLQLAVKSMDIGGEKPGSVPSHSTAVSEFGMSAVGEVRPYIPLEQTTRPSFETADLSHLGAASGLTTTSTINGKSRRVYHPVEEPQEPRNIPIFDRTQPDQDDDYVMVKRSELLKLIKAAEQNKPKTERRTSPPHHTIQSTPSRSTPPPRKIEIVTKPNDLHPLGKFEKLDSSKNTYKLIEKYVQNSHDIPDKHGSVRIHDIYAFKRDTKKTKPTTKKDPSHKILLFYKTTPTGIKRLSSQKDTCIAFYDRIARAFAVPPKDLDRPLRQIILICALSLGKKNKSEHGFSYWCKKGYPSGYDSVKGVGKLTPVWGDNGEIDGVSVPAGATREDGRFEKYELEYSEYVVWEARRLSVWYAVDVEVMVGGRKREVFGRGG